MSVTQGYGICVSDFPNEITYDSLLIFFEENDEDVRKYDTAFEATDEYKEVSLAEGLNFLQLNKASKLYSDGLEENEYITFDSRKGFCYEDGCVIGGTFDMTLKRLISLKWVLHHKFYVKLPS